MKLQEKQPLASASGTSLPKQISDMRGFYKRPFDVLVLVTAHLLLAPVFLFLWIVIPLAIWLEDRGPVFYRQQRPGKNGKIFNVLKFRTMIVNADKVGPAWTTQKDPRITKIGSLLRRTALDELPGVLSIWKGDMSLVGPRALPVKEQALLESTIPGFADRLIVRPGLTGMAQVYNHDDEAHAKLKFDVDYIHNMSLFLDIKLIVLSVRNTTMGRWDARGGKSGMNQIDPPPSSLT